MLTRTIFGSWRPGDTFEYAIDGAEDAELLTQLMATCLRKISPSSGKTKIYRVAHGKVFMARSSFRYTTQLAMHASPTFPFAGSLVRRAEKPLSLAK